MFSLLWCVGMRGGMPIEPCRPTSELSEEIFGSGLCIAENTANFIPKSGGYAPMPYLDLLIEVDGVVISSPYYTTIEYELSKV